MFFRYRISFFVALMLPLMAGAQSFDELRRQSDDNFNRLRNKSYEDFETLRSKANAQYVEALKTFWKKVNATPAVPLPEDRKRPPVVAPADVPLPSPVQVPELVPEPISPAVTPAPAPVEPVVPSPSAPFAENTTEVDFYGSRIAVRCPSTGIPRLKSSREYGVSEMWKALSDSRYDVILSDCLGARRRLTLPDWTYIDFVRRTSEALTNNHNAAVVLQMYLLAQSGFDILPARTESGRLYYLVNTDRELFDYSSWKIGNKRYYLPLKENVEKMSVFQEGFSGGVPAKMDILHSATLPVNASVVRELKSEKYPDFVISVSSNMNLIEMLGDYPVVYDKGNTRSRWSFYANTPLDGYLENQVYGQIRKLVSGKDEKETVEMILNFVQTAFEYRSDDEIWGDDRVFFSSETFYYMYNDCDDRAVLFSRLVRDIAGLDAVLIYYPGHLATAVKFNEYVAGDAFMIDTYRYVVCDPTFIGAGVGRTMTGMENENAYAIPLLVRR